MSKIAAKALFRGRPMHLCNFRLLERQRQTLLALGNGHLPLGAYCAIGYFRDGGVNAWCVTQHALFPGRGYLLRQYGLYDPTVELLADEDQYELDAAAGHAPKGEDLEIVDETYDDRARLTDPYVLCTAHIPVHAVVSLGGPDPRHGDLSRNMRRMANILYLDRRTLAEVRDWRERALRNVMLYR